MKNDSRLGWFEISNSHLNKLNAARRSELRTEMQTSLSFLEDIIVAKYENAKKENGFIYHDRVPKEEELLAELKVGNISD